MKKPPKLRLRGLFRACSICKPGANRRIGTEVPNVAYLLEMPYHRLNSRVGYYFLFVMKKALLLALAGLFSAVAPALAHGPAPANVNFASERGVPFGLVLDGRPLTRGVARQVHVDQLVPGVHWADFSVPTAYGGVVRFRSRVWLEPGLETTFVLIARPGRPLGLRQVNAVALYGPNRGNGYGRSSGGPRYNSPAPYGQGNYSPNGPAPTYPQNGGGYYNNGSSNNGGNGSYDDGDDGDDDYGNNGGTGHGNAPGGAGYYPGSATSSYRSIPPQEVEGLVQAVRQQRFEAGKLSTVKAALAQAALPTDDLKRLLLTLDFEASRVELAKFAYPHVTDPQNFTRVYQTLNFESSKRDVEQAVSALEQEQR